MNKNMLLTDITVCRIIDFKLGKIEKPRYRIHLIDWQDSIVCKMLCFSVIDGQETGDEVFLYEYGKWISEADIEESERIDEEFSKNI